MNPLFKKAILKADKIRTSMRVNMFDPVNVFDICLKLGISIRFVDISMEGMYIKSETGGQPSILLSNQRPLQRRAYTCAHELGHHVFEHGNKLDILSEQIGNPEYYDEDELLVDSFAGALLMPVAGVQGEFSKRKWNFENASAVNFYVISSHFGVGYQTLISHCRINGLVTENKARDLMKVAPAQIFKKLLPHEELNSFKLIDAKSKTTVIDLEVTNFIFLPRSVIIEGDHLLQHSETTEWIAYRAIKPGIVRVASSDGTFSAFVRVQNFQYVGLAENRHLEMIID